MDALQYHNMVLTRGYIGNPLLSKEMYDWAKSYVSQALDGTDSRKMNTDAFARAVCLYMYQQGVKTLKMVTNILRWTEREWIDKHLRPEFDEEYVELRDWQIF